MKRKTLFGLAVVLLLGLLGLMAGGASASLTVIGTATYGGSDYKLIYDDGMQITWLDYTNPKATWQTQVDWASGLGSQLTVTLAPGYTTSIDWSTGWRLPETYDSQANLNENLGYEGPDGNGYHNYRYGWNMVNSEMGHLYYEELGNKGYRATDGTYPPDYGLNNTGAFNNLQQAGENWSSEYSWGNTFAWEFHFQTGYQVTNRKTKSFYALAVHPGEVSAVPIPGAVWLLGSGLLGLIGIRRRARS